MHLSKRLKAVAKSVTKGNRVADIGCDHAYVSIYLLKNKIVQNAIAMDINEGPLKKAKCNILRFHLENHIETRLSDGAKSLRIGEADTILIAGMGGGLTIKILSESLDVIESSKELVLQPQSEIALVRHYLHNIGFEIVNEEMFIDEEKYYNLIKAEKKECTFYEREVFYCYGKELLENRNKVLYKFLKEEKRKVIKILNQLNSQNTENANKRKIDIEQELEHIKEGMNYYEDE